MWGLNNSTGGCFTTVLSNIIFNKDGFVIQVARSYVLVKYVRSSAQAVDLLGKVSALPGKLTQIQGGSNTLKILQILSIGVYWMLFWYLASFKLWKIDLKLASIVYG